MDNQLPSTPFAADLYVTHDCNLRCGFCYYRKFGLAGRRDLSTAAWLGALEELSEMHVFTVRIPGGEPLLRRDLPELIRKIVDCRMRFALNTNGTLLTREHAASWAATGRIDYVQVSLDGLQVQHDAVRGKGSWEKAVNAVRILKAYGIPVKVNMVLTKQNYRECEPACRFFLDELKVDRLRVSAVNVSLADTNGNYVALSDQEYVFVMLKLVALARDYPALARGGSGFLRMYRNIRNPQAPANGKCQVCSYLWNEITIRADGAVIACPVSEDKILGWVGKDPIADVWRHSPVIQQMRCIAEQGRDNSDAKCIDCVYAGYCRQRCPANQQDDAGVSRRCRKDIAELLERTL